LPDTLFNGQGRIAAMAPAAGAAPEDLVQPSEDEAFLDRLLAEQEVFSSHPDIGSSQHR